MRVFSNERSLSRKLAMIDTFKYLSMGVEWVVGGHLPPKSDMSIITPIANVIAPLNHSLFISVDGGGWKHQ